MCCYNDKYWYCVSCTHIRGRDQNRWRLLDIHFSAQKRGTCRHSNTSLPDSTTSWSALRNCKLRLTSRRFTRVEDHNGVVRRRILDREAHGVTAEPEADAFHAHPYAKPRCMGWRGVYRPKSSLQMR